MARANQTANVGVGQTSSIGISAKKKTAHSDLWPVTTTSIVTNPEDDSWESFWDRYHNAIHKYIEIRLSHYRSTEQPDSYYGLVMMRIQNSFHLYKRNGTTQLRQCLMSWIERTIKNEYRDRSIKPDDLTLDNPREESKTNIVEVKSFKEWMKNEESAWRFALWVQILEACLCNPMKPLHREIARLLVDYLVSTAADTPIRNEKLRLLLQVPSFGENGQGRKRKPQVGKAIAACANCSPALVSEVRTELYQRFALLHAKYKIDGRWLPDKKDYDMTAQSPKLEQKRILKELSNDR